MKTSYMEGNTQKDEETDNYAQENALMLLGHAVMRLGHVKMHPCSSAYAFDMSWVRQNFFFHILSGKYPIFRPKHT